MGRGTRYHHEAHQLSTHIPYKHFSLCGFIYPIYIPLVFTRYVSHLIAWKEKLFTGIYLHIYLVYRNIYIYIEEYL